MPSLHSGQLEVMRHGARFKVLSCGRRWGQTRLGSALSIAIALNGGRTGWIAPSYKMGAVGWRGIRMLAQQIPGASLSISNRMATFQSGGIVQVRSADDPQSLRGEGLDHAVLDECAYIKSEAWHEAIRPALSDRKGGALFISTPHGINWFRELWLMGQNPALPDWKSWTFKTSDNPFISKEEIEAARHTMLSRIFRQEYEADFLEDNPGALWNRAWLDSGRVLKAPELKRIVVGVDPTASKAGDACGIIAAGIDNEGAVYVLEDATLNGTPREWATAAITLYHKLDAGLIVAERNQGGEMVEYTLRTVDHSANIRLVHASRGKQARAEPVSALYELRTAHHVGTFTELEDELCQWEQGNESPNRLDALVWAVTELALKSDKRRTRKTLL